MNHGTRIIAVFAGVGFGGGLAYWAYLYLTDPDNAPTFSDLLETAISYFQRGSTIVTGTLLDATGQSSYIEKATTLLAKLEGFSPKTYNDAGHIAIGYGHDILPGDPYQQGDTISESDARDLLSQDLLKRDDCIARSVQVPLTDNQRAALLSFVYNIGCAAFQTSTMLGLINQNDFESASNEFQRWIYSQGEVNKTLVSRRQDEMNLFVS
jgi:lysozyme